MSGIFKVNNINEFTNDNGVTIEGILNKDNNLTCTDLTVNGVLTAPIFNDMVIPNGIITITDQTSSINDITRTYSIDPTGATFSYYSNNTKYTNSTGDSIVFPDSEGQHGFYYDGDTLVTVYEPTREIMETVIIEKCFLAWLYWDATNKKLVLFTGDSEFHGITMDGKTHVYLHETQGSKFRSGCALNSILSDENGSIDTHAQFGIDLGSIIDEDLTTSCPVSAPTSAIPVLYHIGADWRSTITTNFKVLTTGTGRLAWDNAGTLTEIGNNNFVCYHIFAVNDYQYGFFSIMGQAEYSTLVQARTGAENEIGNLITTGLPFAEFVAIATVIFQTSSGYANAVKARIRSDGNGNDYIDFRYSNISPTTGPTNHNNLSGLGSDDHPQYALLEGRDLDILKIDTINEFNTDSGVTIEGILLKDSEINIDIINEKTADTGVTIDGVLLKDGIVFGTVEDIAIKTDTIDELTVDNGVVIEGILLKDSIINTDTINEKTADTGVTIDSVLIKDDAIEADNIKLKTNRIVPMIADTTNNIVFAYAHSEIDGVLDTSAAKAGISSISNSATGKYTITYDTNLFSSTISPLIQITCYAPDTFRNATVYTSTYTTATIGISNEAGAYTNSAFHILTMGPSGTAI